MIFRNLIFVSLLLFLFIPSGCGDSEQKPQEKSEKKKKPLGWLRDIIGNFSSQDTLFLDSGYVDEFLKKYPAFATHKKDIRKFYHDRKYAYAWYDGKSIIEQASNIENRVRNIEYDGVQDSLPYQHELENLMNRPNRKASREELELMLTSQYFALANYAWKGLPDTDIKKLGWFIPRKKISYEAFLDTLLSKPENDFLEEEPVDPRYEALRVQLKKYKDLQAQNAWMPIELGKKKLEPGDSSQFIPQIRKRLFLLGDLNADTTKPEYDDNLVNAVKLFQARHGLEADGIIGKSVIYALNTPLKKRIEQIVVNMERLRWMPRSFTTETNYLLVNIPEFMLHIYENNKKKWDCNVVVGERENKTVIFTGDLKYVVFSPHWNIPESIVKEEILPAIEKDPTYLEKQELEITGERNGVPVIRQKPGTENSLGLVKFMFPNTHNIYLHDSPAKELFNENTRAFSHGCIRVSEPVKLANYLLRDNPSWDQARVTEAMNSGEEKWVTLKNKIPVYITYFTAWVDDQGKLNFRKDLYDNDPRLARMILKSQEAATAMVD